MPESSSDGHFFHKATAILGQRDLMAALPEFYAFMERHFPLEGMVWHHFLPGARVLLGLYLLQKDGVHFLGHAIPFSRAQTMFLRAFSMAGGINSIEDSRESKTATEVNASLEAYIPARPRAHLVCCMRNPRGLLRLIGPEISCFTRRHQQLVSMLSLPLGFALAALLREERVQAFFRANNYPDEAASRADDEKKPRLIGVSEELQAVLGTVKKLAGTDAPVLILGETGSGKELVADAIQERSQRANKPFIKVNCGAIPESLMDSTLFGFERGAFTGAYTTMRGKFEQANGGTLFLDEIGELSPQAQVRLLRTLQNHTVERLGSTESIHVDVRVIAATNRNLHRMLAQGSFREDLYYRLNVFVIKVPPLRERMQDILPLAEHFIREKTKRLNLPPCSGIAPASMPALLTYPWPGNIRELENLIERALILDYGETLRLDAYLQDGQDDNAPGAAAGPCPPGTPEALEARIRLLVEECLAGSDVGRRAAAQELDAPRPSFASLKDVERAHIQAALTLAQGRLQGPGGAGELLGIHPDTLRKRLKKLDMAPKPVGDAEQRHV